ncbi:hypothetical protein L1049_001586 [Liquidambar formosana]|uniref:50S ribosomal protein 5, chloroplastic n=1 Tax=Liquidambar formosana TaxID=63359 RepID=A0AAP0N6H5_LIQFO
MALRLFTPLASLSSSCSSLSSSQYVSTMAIPTPPPITRLHRKPIDVHTKSFNGVRVHEPLFVNRRGLMIVKASSDIDGTGSDSGENPSEGEEEEAVPIENLPLESKLQLKLEQKLRMKMAKKIRLRRKKLIRKRRMRKKGRWPPSKMKKNKNV